MLRLSDGRNFARTFTGLAAIAGTALLLLGQILTPGGTSRGNSVADKVKELGSVKAHKGLYVLDNYLFLAAGVLLMLSAAGLIHVFRGRRLTLGQVASALLVIASAVFFAFWGFGFLEYVMATHAGANKSAFAQVLHQASKSGAFTPFFILFIVSVVVGQLLLAVAAWRRRLIPPWAAAALVAAGILSFPSGRAVQIIGGVLALIGFGMIGLSVLRMSDDDWDAPRERVEAAAVEPPAETPVAPSPAAAG